MMNQPFAQVGGCCVCSDEQGWNENPLVYCDGQGCSVAVHQGSFSFCHKHSPPLSPSLLWDSDSANGAVVLPQVRIPGAAGAGPLRALPKQGWGAQADGQRGLGSRCLCPLHPRGPLWQRGHHGANHPSLGAAGAV